MFKRAILIGVVMLFLGGCTSPMEQARNALAERPPQTCSVTLEGGRTIEASGAQACARLVKAETEGRAMDACAGFAESNEPLCVLAVALKGQGSGSDAAQPQALADRLLVEAMRQDGANKRAWISTIPVVGNLVAQGWNAMQEQKTLRTALENGGTRIGSMELEAEGDATVATGNRNRVLDGDGNVLNEGRNPVTVGTGQPESSLDGDTTFENEAPVEEAPLVGGADDADGGQSIIPPLGGR